VVSDLNGLGSSRHVYRLRVLPPQPSFDVTADALAYSVLGDKPTEITVGIDRRHGFAEEIALHVTGLPEFVTATDAVSKGEGDSAKAVKLTLTGRGGAFSGPIRIEAKSTGPTQQSRFATAAIADHFDRLADLWLTVGTAKP
jgi:hypothetical protein